MSNLPENWVRTTFGSLCDGGQYGWTTRASDQGSVKFLRTTDITKGEIDWSSVPYCQENPVDTDKYLIDKDDILISRSGSVGFSTLISEVPFPTVFASYLIRFVPSKNIDARYVAYFLKSSDYWQQISEAASGIAVSNVNAKKLAGISTPLAPENEQKRIVDKLDNLFARVNACRDRLARIPSILKKYRQAVLRAAMSGELTEDWRQANPDFEPNSDLFLSLQNRYGGERSKGRVSLADNHPELLLPENWLYVPIKAVGEVFLGRQRSPKNHNGPHMRSYIRAANITWKGLDLSDVKEMNFDPSDFERFKLQVGDVLVNEGSGSAEEVGKPAIWNGEIENCCFQNTLICVRPFENMSEYLYYVFLNAALSKDFIKETRGIGIHHLGKTRFAAFRIFLPPLKEQQEIVRRVKHLFAYTDRLEAYYQKASYKAERITTALLNKAFRGELTQQDINEESASTLLKRIQAEKAAKPKKVLVNRKPKMPKITEDYVKEVISQLPKEVFSFDNLRERLSGDYDLIKDILFALLETPDSCIVQVFNQEAQTMQFVRSDK
ncbi:MAG: restriction endonuclease subunit S [Thainema sp.]